MHPHDPRRKQKVLLSGGPEHGRIVECLDTDREIRFPRSQDWSGIAMGRAAFHPNPQTIYIRSSMTDRQGRPVFTYQQQWYDRR